MPNTREKLIELIASKVCDTYSEAYEEWLPHDCRKCYANNCHIAEIADYLIANGVTVQKWIPVTERLPEQWQNVLAFRTDGKIRFDFIGSMGMWHEDYNYLNYPVTHWMPLPGTEGLKEESK